MTMPTDEELKQREDAFKKGRRPDSLGYLTRLRPTLMRFYLDGYSKKSMFDFLTAETLIRCSQATFYRWLTDNVNFEIESAEYLRQEGLARSVVRADVAPPKTAEGDSAKAAITQDQAQTAAVQSTAEETLTTTKKTTVESGGAAASLDTTSSTAESLRLLDSALDGIDEKDMGAVAARARARTAPRDDRGRGGGDG